MITIAGSGFGLYGYLPAIIESGAGKIVLTERSRKKIETRPELSGYIQWIQWVDDEAEVLLHCDTVVVAVPPAAQTSFVKDLLLNEKYAVNRLFLEKPLSPDPVTAAQLIGMMVRAGKTFSIAYTFLFCKWYRSLADKLLHTGLHTFFSLDWNFKAYFLEHDPSSWKADSREGGGVLNFYGIHVIAMMYALGFTKVKSSVLTSEEAYRPIKWHAVFCNADDAVFSVAVNCNSMDPLFHVYDQSHDYEIKLGTPFDEETKMGMQDQRVDPLNNYLRSTDGYITDPDFYLAVNALWKEVLDFSQNKT